MKHYIEYTDSHILVQHGTGMNRRVYPLRMTPKRRKCLNSLTAELFGSGVRVFLDRERHEAEVQETRRADYPV